MVKRIIPFKERLRQRKRMVLFICTGNTCRSPMAAAYFRKLLDDRQIADVEVRSAGVMTITGLLASQEAVQVMDNEGIDLRRHRSTQLTPELVRKADLILSMTPFHRQRALRISDDAKNKTYLLKEFTRSDLKNPQIADPMGCTLEVFKKCFKEIKAACDKLADHQYVAGQRKEEPRAAATGKPNRKNTKRSKRGAATAKSSTAKAGAGKKKPAAKPAPKKAAKKTASKSGSRSSSTKTGAKKKAVSSRKTTAKSKSK